MMFALSLLSMTLVVTQFVVSASLNTVRECTSKRTECGPWGTGVAPRFLATASTGRVNYAKKCLLLHYNRYFFPKISHPSMLNVILRMHTVSLFTAETLFRIIFLRHYSALTP